MLIIDDLSVAYGKHEVLSHLNLTMHSGKIYGIVGYNGAGKTTLLNTIYGVPDHYSNITFDGHILYRSEIAYLDADTFFYPWITGRDYLNLFKAKNASYDFESLCKVFNVPLDQFVDTYSSGMKNKLALIGVLSLNKKILLLDEPFNGLDLESVSALHFGLKKLASSGRLIVITSHILESLSSLCDTIFLLQDRKIFKSFLPAEYSALANKLMDDINAKYNDAFTCLLEK